MEILHRMRFFLALALALLLHLALLALPFTIASPKSPETISVFLAGGPPGDTGKGGQPEQQPASSGAGASRPAPVPAPSIQPLAPLAAEPAGSFPSRPALTSLDHPRVSQRTFPGFENNASGGSGSLPAGTGTGGTASGAKSGHGSGGVALGSPGGPRFARMVLPDYPARAKRLRLTGAVDLLLSIDEKGNLTQVEVTGPAGHGFDEEALRAARRSSFHPAMKEGAPIPSTAVLTVRFEFKQ
jgi:periplasmic protein TonB